MRIFWLTTDLRHAAVSWSSLDSAVRPRRFARARSSPPTSRLTVPALFLSLILRLQFGSWSGILIKSLPLCVLVSSAGQEAGQGSSVLSSSSFYCPEGSTGQQAAFTSSWTGDIHQAVMSDLGQLIPLMSLVSSQCRHREDRLFYRQQHRQSAAQRNGTGGHPGDGVSASTRQVDETVLSFPCSASVL